MVGGHVMCTGRIGGKQGLVGVNIDAAGQAFGGFRNNFQRVRHKQIRPAIAGCAQPEIQIVLDVSCGQRQQVKTVRDSFFQLTHIGQQQMLIQLRLAEQHNLHQLVMARFQVRQQADFFERFQRHCMCFVDQRNHLLALAVDFDQAFLQRADEFGGIAAMRIDREIICNDREHFVTRQRRHRQIDGLDRRRQSLH